MQIKLISTQVESPTLILPFQKNAVNTALIRESSGLSQEVRFSGKFKEVAILHHATNDKRIILFGLGEAHEQVKLATAFRSLFHQHYELLSNSLVFDVRHLDAAILTELVVGATLSTYNLARLKSKPNERADKLNSLEVHLLASSEQSEDAISQGQEIGTALLHTMELVDTPSNIKTPAYIAQKAMELSQLAGFTVKTYEREVLEELGLGALLAVGQGSKNTPVLVELEYKPENLPENAPKIGLVGKGISFDTGGISIKNSTNMHFMKCDMGGAAAVLGALTLATRLRLPVHIVGILACAENMVDANSFRPGDVITSYSGKTIEIIDTDAEGRLVLADGLAWIIKHHAPETLIDLATLTGSAVQTLGYHAAALFTQNDVLASALEKAGNSSHNRVWRLPLWKDYEDELNSDVADVKNLGGRPVAGAITAAKFLEVFTENHPNWAHIDIAGVAFGDSEFTKMRAATGYGVRLLVEFMQNLAATYK